VSGDKDLLVLADRFPVPILTLATFLAMLRGEPD
jgi:predicted nucleic acid-binding protein